MYFIKKKTGSNTLYTILKLSLLSWRKIWKPYSKKYKKEFMKNFQIFIVTI